MSNDEEIFGKRPKEYFEIKEKRPLTFLLSCLYMGFMGSIPIFLGILGFMEIYFPEISSWYWFFILNIVFGILMILGAVKTYKFKKIGIYLFISALITDVLFHLSLGWEELDAIHGLYFFIGFALVPIIPRWKLFE
ncbi:MAG: hypothetical protein LBP34_04290 [Flavobacteriaceae bacterium]|jgi:hypothetical protein|nr:hypothetical protein [Flavobacteriaceae bacterium]